MVQESRSQRVLPFHLPQPPEALRQPHKRSCGCGFWRGVSDGYSRHVCRLFSEQCPRVVRLLLWISPEQYIPGFHAREPSKQERFQNFHDVASHYGPCSSLLGKAASIQSPPVYSAAFRVEPYRYTIDRFSYEKQWLTNIKSLAPSTNNKNRLLIQLIDAIRAASMLVV